MSCFDLTGVRSTGVRSPGVRPGIAVARWVLGAGIVLGTVVALTVPSGAADRDPVAVITRTRTASSQTTIAGTIEVEWVVDGHPRVERAGARADGSGFVVGRGDRGKGRELAAHHSGDGDALA